MPPVSPARVLNRITRELPKGFWERVEAARRHDAANGVLPDEEEAWINRATVLATLKEWGGTFLRQRQKAIQTGQRTSDSEDILALYALTQWRLTRGIYEFDETLSEALLETELGDISAATIRRLPEYAPYIVLNGYRLGSANLHGAWVCKVMTAGGAMGLDLVLHHDNDRVVVLGLNLPNEGTPLTDVIRHVMPSRDLVEQRQASRLAELLVGRMLYLCSREPDLAGVVRKPQKTQRYAKGSWEDVFSAPPGDNMLQVGYKYGGAIRMWQQLQEQKQYDSSGLGMPKAPHIRKAHWHLYWTGTGRTIPEVKWIPPVAVNVKDYDALPVSMRPVLDDPADAAERDPDAAWRRDNGAVLGRLKA